MSNTLYRKSHIEDLANALAALSGLQIVVGDYEKARRMGQRHPVRLTHPPRGTIITYEAGIESREPDIDAWNHCVEAIEAVISAHDYAEAFRQATALAQACYDLITRRGEVHYLTEVRVHSVRRGMDADDIPSDTFGLVATMTARWTLARQEPLYATIESDSIAGEMIIGETVETVPGDP